MHPNPSFRKTAQPEAIRFARTRSFGLLTACAADVPLVAHVPFLLAEDAQTADLHLARSNPIARACTDALPVKLVVTGPDGYVSPDWYGIDDQVPTWNYVAVHLTGRLHPLPADTLPDILARQSAGFEDHILNKTPWTMDKMSDEALSRLMRMILPFRLEVTQIDSTFKLGQNKDAAVRKRAAAQMPQGFGSELDELSELMRNPPPEG